MRSRLRVLARAPKIVGGAAYPAVAGEGVARMADAMALRDVEIERLGDDVLVSGYVEGRSRA